MLPPFELHMLADAVVGAAGGAAIVGLLHLWRDRHRLITRWRAGGTEPDESIYLPDGATDEERRKLPAAMASGALSGSIVWVGFQAGSMVLFILGFAIIALVQLFYTLVEDRADEVGAPPTDLDAEGEPRPSRASEFLTKAFALLTFLGFPIMTFDEFGPVRERLGLDLDDQSILGWALGAFFAIGGASALWSGIQYFRTLPDAEDIGHRASYDTTRQDAYRMLAAIGITGLLASLILWLLF